MSHEHRTHFGDRTYNLLMKMVANIRGFEQETAELEAYIHEHVKNSEVAKRLMKVPGIGPINASIAEAIAIDHYETPRDFAASLGVVPKQNTTGGDIKLGHITKKGNAYVRSNLMMGGGSIIMHGIKRAKNDQESSDSIEKWAYQKYKEKGFRKAAIAVANKLARVVWVIVVRGEEYRAA